MQSEHSSTSVALRSNFGHSTFHSGTVKLEKRYSRGLIFSTFYTFSKALDSQDADFIHEAHVENAPFL